MAKLTAGGGWQAIRYTLRKARQVGPIRLWKAMRTRNVCKTCAVGMGGQRGGMVNEAGHFPEFCKKSMQAMVADMQGRIDPAFFEKYSIDDLKALTPRELEALGRIVDPLVAGPGDTHFRVTDWTGAIRTVTERLSETRPERAFFYASGRSSNEAGFLLQLLARVYGTNHVSNCSYYCHQASGVGLKESLGTPTATIELDDLDQCDLLFLIGGNPASNHPRLMSTMTRLRRRGGKVIVVNPVRELGMCRFKVPSDIQSLLGDDEIATLYVQPKIGGDIAFMAGLAKSVIENDWADLGFVDQHTEGYDAVRQLLDAVPWEQIEAGSGVPRHVIEEAAAEYGRSERAVFAWTMGITHHLHGVENVQWIVNLALLRGMVGKPGAGLMPIRGHSNVQGMGTVGVSPAVRDAALEGLRSLGIEPPNVKGHDTLAALEASHAGAMDYALCLGGNLYGASPDSTFVESALARVRTVTYLSTTLNTGHVLGRGETTVILPVLARDEETQSTTQESMFNFVRLSDGGTRRQAGPRSEVDIITDIAEGSVRGRGSLDWTALKDHEAIRKLIARLVPSLERIKEIGASKVEFHIPGRLIHEPQFATPDGKAQFRAHALPDGPELMPDQLLLMTVRSEGQFNTVVYEEEDLYRGQERRDVILMSGWDMQAMGLRQDQLVTVTSEAGAMEGIRVRDIDIAKGCAVMYFPEANILVPRRADPKSKTPAYKQVLVTVKPASRLSGNGALIRLSSEPAHRRASRQRMKSC